MLRCSRNRSKQKQEIDPLQVMLDELNDSQELEKMHRLIPIGDMYLYQLEKNFNRYEGLKYYESFDEYVNIIVIPYLNKQNVEEIGDLKYE